MNVDICVYIECFFAPLTAFRLMRTTADGGRSDDVDLYNSESGAWSTAQLSVARGDLTAASVGNAVLFAGGSGGVSLCMGLILIVRR